MFFNYGIALKGRNIELSLRKFFIARLRCAEPIYGIALKGRNIELSLSKFFITRV